MKHTLILVISYSYGWVHSRMLGSDIITMMNVFGVKASMKAAKDELRTSIL